MKTLIVLYYTSYFHSVSLWKCWMCSSGSTQFISFTIIREFRVCFGSTSPLQEEAGSPSQELDFY